MAQAHTRFPLIVIGLFLIAGQASAQYAHHPLPQHPEAWTAQWITHPGVDKTSHALVHFRHTFTLERVPDTLIVHISGDNRYRLHINGEVVAYGPQLSDQRHWRYETIDIAPFLQAGRNVLAAEVMNWGVERSYGIISFQTGFLLQGHGPDEAFLNTSAEGWKTWHNGAVHEKPVHWRRPNSGIVGGFYAANPTDSIVAADYPWGWQTLDFDDSDWVPAAMIFSQPKTSAGYGHGWILQPRTTAIQTSRDEPIGRVRRVEGLALDEAFAFGERPLRIPPRRTVRLLIDKGHVTLGYPKLFLSGGHGAEVRLTYSEALYDERNRKGHRDSIEGKVIKGISDVYIMDGKADRLFQPIWFRTFRFVQLDITTASEALVIEDFHHVFSAADFPYRARFATTDALYQQVWDLCAHGLRICAQDNLLSDAFYEQMQYVGDLRPHLKAWTTLTGDLTYFHSALEQFNYSRLPDGNITSCYPLKATFVHPTYSLIWIDMLHDLMMREGDKSRVEGYLGEIQEVFDYYESLINEQGLVGDSEYNMFIDWYVPKGGNSPVNADGNSAILTLNYAYTLDRAADLMTWLGFRRRAAHYRAQSRKYAEIVRKHCFDPERGIYADDPAHTFYDQRASILAVLAGAHDATEKQALMHKLLDPATDFDSRANLFYYFYLFEAMEATGVGDFTAQLAPWRAMVDLGMSATPEKRVEQDPRSEVHPWTAHPVHYYFSVVAGIQPTRPGFAEVRIAPNPGNLGEVEAVYPTVRGDIRMALEFGEDGKLSGNIFLPDTMAGQFVWEGKQRPLRAGLNKL